MIEQTTNVLNVKVLPLEGVSSIYGHTLVVSGPLQLATEIPVLTLVSLGRTGVEQARRSELRWELITTGGMVVSEDPERERLRDMARKGEIVLGPGGMPDGFWDMPAPEDPEGLVRKALIEDRNGS